MSSAALIKPGILLVENFIDSVHLLPADVSRHLGYIQALDERIEDLKDQAAVKLHMFVQRWKGTPPPLPEEAHAQRMEIDSMHGDIVHFGEEKRVWADQLYEMLASRVDELHELKQRLQFDAAAVVGPDTPSGSQMPSMSLNALPGAGPMASSQLDMFGSVHSGPPGDVHGGGLPMTSGQVVIPLPSIRKSGQAHQRPGARRSPSSSQHLGLANGVMPGGGVMGMQGQGGAHPGAMAGAPGMYHGQGVPYGNMQYSGGAPGRAGGTAPGMNGGAGAMMYGYPSAGGAMEPAAAAQAPYAQVFRPVDPSMVASSSKPQSRHGKVLQPHDISSMLVGKQAELLWPDDRMWYVIRIQSLDVHTKTADILYMTGETENGVDLDEIAVKKEMRILPG